MRTPASVKALEDLGRVQLSKTFFMRDFLYSEISQIERIPNIPDDPDLAIAVGSKLCVEVLEPIQARFGRLCIRSAYRSSAVNGKGAENRNQYGCAQNKSNFARHIWDVKDAEQRAGAMACIVVTSFIPYFERTGDWEALAWWVHDNVPAYSEMEFFTRTRLLAFNVGWHEAPAKTIHAWAPTRRCLTKPGMENHCGRHEVAYSHWLEESAT
jgi:hypothetical protein